ncbi:MAG: radical SAM protein [candidate division WOR-3 bacterium]
MKKFIYEKPINVYFESTIACDLKCKHCRAEAIPERSPSELKTEEVKNLMDDIKNMGSHLVISGGDPLKREDLFELLLYAKNIKLPVAVTPTTSPLATYENVKKMKELSIYALGISLDGPDKNTQDSFRGVNGTFENSMSVLNYAKELSIKVQVNTTCTRETIERIKEIYYLLLKNFSPPVNRWSVFFLVPVGRGAELELPSKREIEDLLLFLYEKSKEAPFHITTTEAPFYKIFYTLKEIEKGKSLDEIIMDTRKLGLGVRDGNGVIFVSYKGDIYPAGFLPLKLGNVRENKLSYVYENNEILKNLRNTELLKGKCGICYFKDMCGGSRARAYTMKGDYLEEDPVCIFDEKFLKKLKVNFSQGFKKEKSKETC